MSYEDYCLTFFGKEIERCLNSTCRFYIIKPGTSEFPIPNGCGVLFQLNDDYYCLSNAHVLADNKIGKNFLITEDRKKLVLGGRLLYNRVEQASSRRYDRIDIAVMKLTQQTVDMLIMLGYNFISLSDIRTNYALGNKDVVCIIGYPGNWTKVSKSRRLIIDKPFIGRSLPYVGEFGKLGLDSRYHHVLSYSRNILVDSKTKENIIAPKPHGISGSGVWLVTGAESAESYRHLLIGIFSEYIENSGLIAGTKIGLFLDLLMKML